jgi:hypothetical protein
LWQGGFECSNDGFNGFELLLKFYCLIVIWSSRENQLGHVHKHLLLGELLIAGVQSYMTIHWMRLMDLPFPLSIDSRCYFRNEYIFSALKKIQLKRSQLLENLKARIQVAVLKNY